MGEIGTGIILCFKIMYGKKGRDLFFYITSCCRNTFFFSKMEGLLFQYRRMKWAVVRANFAQTSPFLRRL